MSTEAFIDHITHRVEQHIDSKFTYIAASKLGLDDRCGAVYVENDGTCIAVNKNNVQRLDYYGGFEYVDSTSRVECGEFVFFFDHDGRVQECLKKWQELVDNELESI